LLFCISEKLGYLTLRGRPRFVVFDKNIPGGKYLDLGGKKRRRRRRRKKKKEVLGYESYCTHELYCRTCDG
jgi:hypothetical protein